MEECDRVDQWVVDLGECKECHKEDRKWLHKLLVRSRLRDHSCLALANKNN
jgi:hypothetical protein